MVGVDPLSFWIFLKISRFFSLASRLVLRCLIYLFPSLLFDIAPPSFQPSRQITTLSFIKKSFFFFPTRSFQFKPLLSQRDSLSNSIVLSPVTLYNAGEIGLVPDSLPCLSQSYRQAPLLLPDQILPFFIFPLMVIRTIPGQWRA